MQGITRDSLDATAAVLETLAVQDEWFNLADFPPPASGQGSARYALHVLPDQSYALYLNAQHPGKNSVPHDHKTWAVITGIAGDELNRVYRRETDEAAGPGHARLLVERQVLVSKGTSVSYLGDDIHSIHIQGNAPTLHFHLYGKALETLTERLAYDPQTGVGTPYNKGHWRPNAG